MHLVMSACGRREETGAREEEQLGVYVVVPRFPLSKLGRLVAAIHLKNGRCHGVISRGRESGTSGRIIGMDYIEDIQEQAEYWGSAAMSVISALESRLFFSVFPSKAT